MAEAPTYSATMTTIPLTTLSRKPFPAVFNPVEYSFVVQDPEGFWIAESRQGLTARLQGAGLSEPAVARYLGQTMEHYMMTDHLCRWLTRSRDIAERRGRFSGLQGIDPDGRPIFLARAETEGVSFRCVCGSRHYHGGNGPRGAHCRFFRSYALTACPLPLTRYWAFEHLIKLAEARGW